MVSNSQLNLLGFDLLFFVQVTVVCIAALMIGLAKRFRDKVRKQAYPETPVSTESGDVSQPEDEGRFEEAASLRLRERLLE